jgi:serine protease Do
MNRLDTNMIVKDARCLVARFAYPIILIIAFLAAGCGRNSTIPKVSMPSPSEPGESTIPGTTQASFAGVVNRVSPAVVTVLPEKRMRTPRQHPFLNDPFFRDFFGDRLPQPQPRHERGLGSGVIVSNDGYILTNHHVVDGAEQIRIELVDRRTFDAKVVGSDPRSDLAVLKIDAKDLPTLALGNSDQVRVGDVALALGNPLGIGQTVTAGIISAKGRSTGVSDGSFEDFLQTDAPINRGNSGGALVNTNGELIGINSQILSPSGGNIGIGFAIPANMARNVMDQLIKTGQVRRGQLGVVVQTVTQDIASSMGLKEARGVIVSQVQPNSGAERAGLRRGDVITALNGEPINDSNLLRNMVASTAPGSEVTLTILRDGGEQQLRATLGELQAAEQPSNSPDNNGNTSGDEQLGLNVQPLTPRAAAQLNLPSGTQGLVVMSVDSLGRGADAGIREGDVIEQINQKPVRSAADLRDALQRAGSNPMLLLINRRGATIFLTVRPRA